MNVDMFARLTAVADGQWGMLTTDQCQVVGADEAAVATLRQVGLIDDVAEGVVRLRAGAHHPTQRLYAAWLRPQPRTPAWERQAPGCGMASHAAALRVYRAGDVPGPSVEFTMPVAPPSAADTDTLIHVASVERDEWREVNSMPVTTPGRTLADVAATGRLDLAALGRAAQSMLRSRHATADHLAAALRRRAPQDAVHADLDRLLAAAGDLG